MPQFEAETGMTLEVTAPALGPLIEKTLQNLQAPQSSFDIINFLGFLTTQQVGAGYYEQLNQYIDNPALTAPDWDVADFLAAGHAPMSAISTWRPAPSARVPTFTAFPACTPAR